MSARFFFSTYEYGDNSTKPPGDGLYDLRHQEQRNLIQQLIISALLGIGAFSTFCLLRPKWPHFYYARKIRMRNASLLPELPDTLFGWIPALWRISEDDVLATAGLDAYVFLAFFKMAIRFLFVASVLAAVVLVPIHTYFKDDDDSKDNTANILGTGNEQMPFVDGKKKKPLQHVKPAYLWANLIFVYVFTGLAYYFLWKQTEEVVQVRQTYLGNQATVTDKTVKLSGIPEELRSEGVLKEHIEKLAIGAVEKITICRQWGDLDQLLNERSSTLRKLEEVYTVYHARKGRRGMIGDSSERQFDESGGEEEGHSLLERRPSYRPQLTLRYGKLKLRTKKVDALDYYTDKLQDLDDQITEARQKEYRATPLAFVTMKSVSSAQVATQVLMDPTPGAMVARPAPSPSDVIWPNTYLSRSSRWSRSWAISTFITLSSIFWLVPVAALAGLWNTNEIHKIWPQLADTLKEYPVLASFVQTFLPTAVLTLLNVAVPYFYDWLSQFQGLISQEEVELSVISKNFFFAFFNLFLAFTVFGTAFNFHSFWETLNRSFKDTASIALALAEAVEDLGPFYINLIILQGLGMFPFRLLQVGSVTLYPITKFGAKTPRDYDELKQPAIFQYGFFLPQPILIYIICIVYSVLEHGVLILTFGLIYFVLGYFTYKYQLLYAMDHPGHSTGKAWPIIVYRVFLGLLVFQLTMTGWLALRQAFTSAGLILPLLAFTIWSYWHYTKNYLPSNYYIALRCIQEEHGDSVSDVGMRHTVDEEREEGQVFVNPSLVSPLERPWAIGDTNGHS
ncbi:hypothetical protein BZA05DRAFT_441079 [Tricharina praecox]|uniref:uncharacterized protein n=1 Tax=Tricharina praecox TaxID=43433 RepID=UPI00221E69AF|nr:uncharacterized protein BZA05DRAFT_441079 [Tricharina praecox]KAI5857772.1 hypothetical protein BZA05DRAFT_441079 [Tricharina praecox]